MAHSQTTRVETTTPTRGLHCCTVVKGATIPFYRTPEQRRELASDRLAPNFDLAVRLHDGFVLRVGIIGRWQLRDQARVARVVANVASTVECLEKFLALLDAPHRVR